MAKRRDRVSRREVTERIETNKKDMEQKEVDLEKVAADVETVKQTIEGLEFGGTAEGADQLEKSMEGAQDVTRDVFEKEDENLEGIQSSSQEFEGEITDHRNTSESDLGKITDSGARIETRETVNELARAKETVLRDIDYLTDQINRATDARKKSDTVQEKLISRVNTAKRRR